MGEINDSQMETDLQRYFCIGNYSCCSANEIPLWGLKDEYLVEEAKKTLETDKYNINFEKLGRSIVKYYKRDWILTEKQRNVLYGLLS